MDPITLLVTALAAGAAAGLKPIAEIAIKDAYQAVKALIHDRYENVSLAGLEDSPGSELQHAALGESLEKVGATHDEELLLQAQALLRLIRDMAPELAGDIDINLGDIEAGANIDIGDFAASGNIRLEAGDLKAQKDVNLRGFAAGGGQSSPKA